jgi:ABC-type transporter Mla MlaB component
MLRILLTINGDHDESIRLEGSLHGPWVDELRKVLDSATAPPDRIRLDLSALIYLDEQGRELLCEWLRRGAEVVACSRYVSAVLQLEE